MLVALLLLASFGGAAAVLWRWQSGQVLGRFVRDARRLARSVADEIAAVVEVATGDALLLARSPTTRAAVDGGAALSDEARAAITRLFLAFARTRTMVSQVRLLGADGRERVRVERGGPSSAPTVATRLQNKSDRYYFSEAKKLRAGQVYVSPLDLNVEYGRIERPLHPTVRYSTPLYRAGQLVGVIVVNQHGRHILARVEHARRPGGGGQLLLVDAHGSYLLHHDHGREWGRQLGTNHRLGRDYPHIARWLRSNAAHEARSGVWLGDEHVAARADTRAVGGGFASTVLLVASRSAALQARASAFIPLTAGLAIAVLMLGGGFVGYWRFGAMRERAEREHELRREIEAREGRLQATQERLVASERLAVLSELAATLAHELRNPLGAIVNSAELLRADDALDEDDRNLLEIVRGECQRLERTVTDFLSLARPPAPRCERVALAAVVRDVVTLARHDPALAQDLELEVQTADDTPEVDVDVDALHQILWNLLRNAASATRGSGGKLITVRTGACELDGADAAMLDVLDEGPGPPRSFTATEPSRDGDDAEGQGGGGSRGVGGGLGLIVVAGIVGRHDGRFELRAREERRGARARVVLPAAAAGPSEQTKASEG